VGRGHAWGAVGGAPLLQPLRKRAPAPSIPPLAACRKKKAAAPKKKKPTDPLDFVALMAAGCAVPVFDCMPSASKTRRRKAKAPADTLLPEDHHYEVRRRVRLWEPQASSHCTKGILYHN
jgi:hypothetical protein